MSVLYLKQKRQSKSDAVKAIWAGMEAAGADKLDDAQKRTVEQLQADIKELDAQIALAQDAEDTAKRMADEAAAAATTSAADAAQRNANPGAAGAGTPAPAKNGASDGVPAEPVQPVFRNFGENVQAVYRAANPNYPDREAYQRARNMLDEVAKRSAQGLNEKVGSDGAFAMQQDIAAGLLKRATDKSLILPMCTPVELSSVSNSLKIRAFQDEDRRTGHRMGGVAVAFVDEAATTTSSRPKLRTMEIFLKKLMGFWYATNESVEDLAVLNSLVEQCFIDELAWIAEEAVLWGGGVIEPLGMLNTANKALVTVAAEGGQATGTVVPKNITKMVAAMLPESFSRAIWVASPDVIAQLPLELVMTGTTYLVPLYMPPTGLSGAPYGTLYGRPIFPSSHASAKGSAGDLSLIDPSEYLVLSKQGGVRLDSSIHVAFTTDESCFRIVQRIGGAPKWDLPVTQAKSSTTLSPYVTLAARP